MTSAAHRRCRIALALGLAGASTLAPASAPQAAATEEPRPGRVSRAAVEAVPAWAAARGAAAPDPAAARALRDVPPGATVRVYLGTWCPDSRREVTRFWKALDQAGGPVPFAVELVAVDRDKAAPGGLAAGAALRYVPTFVVLRKGKEVGRVVESAPAGIEADLGALLRGTRTGVLTGRPDLAR